MQKRRPYRHIAKDEKNLVEMLLLRRLGFSVQFLADYYGCDRETLRYHCRKYQIFPQRTNFAFNPHVLQVFNPRRIAQYVIIELYPQKVSNWVVVDGERVNTGKSYKDYLAANSPYKSKEKTGMVGACQ